MKNFILLFVSLVAFVGTAQAAKLDGLVCVDRGTIFDVDLQKNVLTVIDRLTHRPLWSDKVSKVVFVPGFETIPSQTRMTILLEKAGKIEGLVIDRMLKDSEGLYQEVRGAKYSGRMTASEGYYLENCELEYK